jgi:2-polyprenyl-3-methyl-5-hydroxy-6-metoxy-1,4-benzoquinol methylase
MRINDIRPKKLLKMQELAIEKDLEFYRNSIDKFTNRNCPGCFKLCKPRDGEFKNYFLKEGFNYYRCESCWTLFMNPGPTESLIKEFYQTSENYKYFAEYIYPESREKRNSTIHKSRAQMVLESAKEFGLIQNNLNLRILEIGAGDGATLTKIKELMPDTELTSLEPNIDSIKSGANVNSGFKIINANFENAILDIGKQDIILGFEVLEHILNPVELFTFAQTNLKSNGLLILSTPNAHSIEINFLKENSTSVDLEHISILTPSAIYNLANATNFVVEKVSANGLLDAELILDSFKLNKLNSWIFNKLFNIFKIQYRIRSWNISSFLSTKHLDL